jgi:hypothetical protein
MIFKRKHDNKRNPAMVLMCKFDGVEYYTYQDAIDLPPVRGVAAEKASRFTDAHMNEDYLKMSNKKMIESFNKKDMATLGALIKEQEFRLTFLTEMDTLLDMASIYFYTRNENPIQINDDLRRKKIADWKRNDEALNFFLKAAIALTQKYGSNSEENILQSLREAIENELRKNSIL